MSGRSGMWRGVFVFACAVGISACQEDFGNIRSEEIADVFVTASLPVKWKDVRNEIKPAELKEPTAVQMTRSVEDASKLNFFINKGGSSTGIGTQTPATAAASATAASVDAYSGLMAGIALRQQNKILQSIYTKGETPDGYNATLVTFQVDVQPLRRNQDMTIFVTISVFPKNIVTTPLISRPVVIVPLVVTDALELTQTTNSSSMGLSAAGGFGGLGLSLDEKESGSEKNSIITLGRINDNTLRVRIGAPNGDDGRELYPRSYNVSVLLLTNNELKDKELKAVAHTTFNNSEGKSPVEFAKKEQLAHIEMARNVVPTVERLVTPKCFQQSEFYTFQQNYHEELGENQNPVAVESAEHIFDFLVKLYGQDFSFVERVFKTNECSPDRLPWVLTGLNEAMAHNRYSLFSISLPKEP